MNRSYRFEPPETAQLRMELIRRSWSLADLALRCGMQYRNLANQFSLDFPCLAARFRIETLFDMPIWSSPSDFELRKKAKAHYGFDLWFATGGTLRQFATDCRLPGRSRLRRKALIVALATHLFPNPNPKITIDKEERN